METRICQNCKASFTLDPDDFSFYEKMKLPAPTFCPACRLQRRMTYFNVRTLYNRLCDMCGKKMVSIYRPEAAETVYCMQCYFSDKWDPLSYGVEYDFTRDFFTQFKELHERVPQLNLEQLNNNGVGCEYANYTFRSSHVYLSYNVVGSEHIYYSTFANKGNTYVFDSLNFRGNELCYELVDSNENYQCQYLTKSHVCITSSFLFNCVNCQDCFMSSNLRNKKYVFRNQQLTREAYLAELARERLDSHEAVQKLHVEYESLMHATTVRFAYIINSPDCTGDMIENSHTIKDSFYIWNSENLRYVTYSVNTVKDSYDVLDAGRGEKMYETVCCGRGNSNLFFSFSAGSTVDVEYSHYCNDLHHAFGSVGVTKKDYCIFNKQYSEEEYKTLREKIIIQMNKIPYVDKKGNRYSYGEFFPAELSPFTYNETMAYEQFFLTKDEAEKEGYLWYEPQEREHVPTIQASELPDLHTDIPDTIVNELIGCEHGGECAHLCTKAFRIVPEELLYYKRMKMPLPHMCPNCRYFKRLETRSLPWKLWHRKCMNTGCKNEFETPYAPDRPEIVYCESCYQKEIL